MRLLEFVNEETVVMRHPEAEEVVRKFFRDARGSSVRAFEASGKSGYVFFTPENEESGDFFQLAITAVNADESDQLRFQRQVTHGEWFTGKFVGPLHRVSHIEFAEESDR